MDRNTKLEAARRNVATLLTLADGTGSAVGPAEIHKAALVKLSPAAAQAATLLANLVLANLEGIALTIAGLADDKVLAKLLVVMDLDA